MKLLFSFSIIITSKFLSEVCFHVPQCEHKAIQKISPSSVNIKAMYYWGFLWIFMSGIKIMNFMYTFLSLLFLIRLWIKREVTHKYMYKDFLNNKGEGINNKFFKRKQLFWSFYYRCCGKRNTINIFLRSRTGDCLLSQIHFLTTLNHL